MTTMSLQLNAEDPNPVRDQPLLDNAPSRRVIASTTCTLARPALLTLCLTQVNKLYHLYCNAANNSSQFANLQMGTQSLTHTVPKGKDVYAVGYPTYPFPVVPNCSSSVDLLRILPERSELLACIEMFQRRAQSCSFPHTPEEATRKEVERFLDDAEYNAQKAPDMLALIFVTLAMGLQMGQFDRNGGKWNKDSSEKTRGRCDVFCKCIGSRVLSCLLMLICSGG